jgi:cysteine-rich repeat protein
VDNSTETFDAACRPVRHSLVEGGWPMLLVVPVTALLLSLPRLAGATDATALCAPNADPCTVSTARTVDPGSVLDLGTRQLEVTPTGSIMVPSGELTIVAGSVRLETHAKLLGGQTADGTGANVKITTTGDIRVETGSSGDAQIDVSASLSPGEIDLTAGGAVVILGQVHSDATTSGGSGGTINVTSGGDTTVSGLVRAQGGTAGVGGQITIMAGGNASASGTLRANGGEGGDVEMDALNGDVTGAGTFDGSSNANVGDGGSVTMIGSNNLSLTGQIALGAHGTQVNSGDGGDSDLEATSGSLTMSGSIDAHGSIPDGDGGEIDMTAGVDYTQSGAIDGSGAGSGSCGDLFDGEIGRNVSVLGTIDETGGFCGGEVDFFANSVVLASTSQLLADSGMVGGTLDVEGQTITAGGKAYARGTLAGSSGGLVQLTGCDVSVPSGAAVRSDGTMGQNLLQASGQLTIGGTVESRSGENRFEYLDPSHPPITLPTAVVDPTIDCAPAAGCLNPSLSPCAAAAVCGNGIVEAGEECDDGNTVACDGCSPTCRVERCGNGRIECGEECDDGSSNGVPGDPCDASCRTVHAANILFVAATRRGRNGCGLEWAVENAPERGFASKTQSCIDGDPACDADGKTDGVCTFNVSGCLNVTDARLPRCTKRTINYVKIRQPDPLNASDAVGAANANQVVTALDGLGVTIRVGDKVLKAGSPDARGDHCTQTFVQRVPHPAGVAARRLLSATATDINGAGVKNRLSLRCLPNKAVCGNGVVEIGEQCDDGNTNDCDGCSAKCTIERCGNGVVECGEQCDDGPNNGTAGDPCSTTCGWAPAANRLPGGRNDRSCAGEFSLAAAQLATVRGGIPSTRQVCVDGDPSCDFDPTPGVCRFHVWFCFGGADPRLACAAETVTGVRVVSPTAAQSEIAAAARTAIDTALRQMVFPVGPGEVCSPRVELDLPVGRAKLFLKTDASTAAGFLDRSTLRLSCERAGTVP